MDIKSIYPVFIVRDIAKTRAFYLDNFEFEIRFELDWFLNLKHPSSEAFRLVFVRSGHESVPAFYEGETKGFALDLEVADAAAEFERLNSLGVRIIQELRDEPFGERHFVVADPDGILINITQNI